MRERLFLRLDDDAVQAPEATTPPGTLRAWSVSAPLRRHVAHVLAYREVVPAGQEVLERVLPDASVRLIFNWGDAPSVGGRDSERLEIVGASAAPALVRLRARVEGLSVTVRPGAASALLGVPAGEIAGRALPIDALWCGDAAEAAERMAASADDAARVRVLQELIERRLRGRERPPPAALEAVRLISASQGRRPVREVADALGIGERRLQQLFFAEVGVTPRTFGRVARLQGLLRTLRRQRGMSWAEVALDGGFYDQSHLANEFRALAGMSPTEFMARTVSGSSKTSA